MPRYSQVDTRIFMDEKVRELSLHGAFLWTYLLVGKETSSLPGLLRAGAGSISDSLHWLTPDEIRKAFVEIEERGMAKADWRAPLIWIPNVIRYNPPANRNVVAGWGPWWAELPDSDLKPEAWTHLHAVLLEQDKARNPTAASLAPVFAEHCPKPKGSSKARGRAAPTVRLTVPDTVSDTPPHTPAETVSDTAPDTPPPTVPETVSDTLPDTVPETVCRPVVEPSEQRTANSKQPVPSEQGPRARGAGPPLGVGDSHGEEEDDANPTTPPSTGGAESVNRKPDVTVAKGSRGKSDRKRPAPPDPRYTPLLRQLVAVFLALRKAEYKFDKRKDPTALTELLKLGTDDEILAAWKRALASTKWPLVSTLSELVKCWNHYSGSGPPAAVVQIRNPKAPVPAEATPREVFDKPGVVDVF